MSDSISSEVIAQRILPYMAGRQLSPRLLLDQELVATRIAPGGPEELLLREASAHADELLFVQNLRERADIEILDRVM